MTGSIIINALLKIVDWGRNSMVGQGLIRLDRGLVNIVKNSILVKGLLKEDGGLWHKSRLYQLMLGLRKKLDECSSRVRIVVINSKTIALADSLTANSGNSLEILRNSYIYKIINWIVDYEH